MKGSDFSLMLTSWRHERGLRQSDMADVIGVSQGTISRWEAGTEVPPPHRLREITMFLREQRSRDPFVVDKTFVSLQTDVRALFDHNEARLLAVSEGLRKLWPSFATLIGVEMRRHLVGESRLIYDDARLAARIKMRDVGIIIGISDRHVELSPDDAVRHRWILAFRHYPGHTLAEMLYEACDPGLPPGIQRIISVNEASAAPRPAGTRWKEAPPTR